MLSKQHGVHSAFALHDRLGLLLFGELHTFDTHSETSDPEGLRAVLGDANGEVGRVRKHRTVFRIGQTRVHLDRVDGLGEFLELEVTVDDTLESEAAVSEAHRLVAALVIEESALVKGAYVDLLTAGVTHAR
jgi:predicted adenylyl cyclase CyaB